MDKKTTLRAFNDHFNEFVMDVLSVFPENTDIRSAKTTLDLAKRANPTLVIKIWFMYVYSPYAEKIDSGDLDFFIYKDYSADLNGIPNSKDILSSVNALRDPIKEMSESNKQHSLKYVQNLCKLSSLYNKG
jgi:hypothetical protein